MTESELITRLRERDPLACRYLLDTYGKRVYNTALGLLQHPQDAEDIAQEVFAQAFQSVAQFKGQAAMSTWLYRITVNKVHEWRRNRTRKKRFGILISIFDAGETTRTTDFVHPGIVLENREQAGILFKAIDKLPENQKTAFILHKLEELPYAEIAEVMQTSTSAVDSLLVRARQNLRKWLTDYYNS